MHSKGFILKKTSPLKEFNTDKNTFICCNIRGRESENGSSKTLCNVCPPLFKQIQANGFQVFLFWPSLIGKANKFIFSKMLNFFSVLLLGFFHLKGRPCNFIVSSSCYIHKQ